VKNIALKATEHKNYQDSSDDSEGETLSLLTKKFNKFLKRNNKYQSFDRYNSKKLNDFNFNKYTCFGCGEQGHIKVDCPNNENKERGASKKREKKGDTNQVAMKITKEAKDKAHGKQSSQQTIQDPTKDLMDPTRGDGHKPKHQIFFLLVFL